MQRPVLSMKTESYLGLGPSGFHRLAYAEWGAATAPRTLVCVHGLTRNSRDFDRLAAALSRTLSRDLPGRGRAAAAATGCRRRSTPIRNISPT